MYFKKWKDFIKTNEVNTPIQTTTQTPPTNSTSGVTPSTPVNTQPVVNSGTNANTNTTSNTSDATLQEKLNRWNSLYSQEFKFKNNMPNNVGENTKLSELISNIVDECGGKVQEGINKLIDEFKKKEVQDEFNNKTLKLVGYTSTTASEAYNQKLSLRRAKIVANVIKNEIENNKIPINIKLIEEGKGESLDGLIVINDQSLDPIKWGKLAPKFSPEDEKKLLNSKEERQKVNRRVIITLPNVEVKPIPIKLTTLEDKVIETKKPELPKPTSITFNYDSFILTNQGSSIITTFINELKKWNTEKKDENIKNIYISAHTKLGNGGEPSMAENQKNMLVILSANRGQYIKDFIRKNLGEDLSKSINIIVYPVAFTMGTDSKKVVINFEKGDHMKEAETKFIELSKQYNLPIKNNSLENLATYLDNKALEKSIEFNIKGFIKNDISDQCIPLELYYDELNGYDGFQKYTNFRNSCKEQYTKLITRLNKKYGRSYKPDDFIYKPE